MSLYKHFLTVVLAATLTSVAMTNHVYAEEEFSISITGPDGETRAPRAAQPVRPAQPVRTAPAANRATAQTQAPATTPATNAQGTQPRTPATTAPATQAPGAALAAGQGAAGQGATAPSGAATTHTVQPRETIWSIAHRYSAPYNDVNEFQAVASIYRNNRTAFEDSDVNRIRRGANLTIPSHDAMALEQTQTGSDLLSRGITDLPPLPTRLAANQSGQTGAQGANAQASATATANASAQTGTGAGTGTPAATSNAQALAQNQTTPPAPGEVAPTIPTFTARETMLRDANPVWVAPDGSYEDYTKVLTDAQLAEQNATKTQEYVPEITRSSMDLQAIEQLLDKTERNIQTAQKDIYKRLDDNIQRSAQVARETATVTAQEEVADLINHYEQVIAELQQSNNDLRANLSRINKQVEQIRGIQLETADSMAELDRRLGADPLTGAATSSSGSSFQSGPIMWVLLIIGAIAFLLSIGLFIFKSRMRRERAIASSYDDDSGDFMDEEDIEISNLLAKANLAAEHDQAAQKSTEPKQEPAQPQPAPQPAPAPAPAPAIDDSFDSGFDGSLGDFGADAPAPAPAPVPAPASKAPAFHDDIEIPGYPSSKSAAPVAPAPKTPGPTGASLAAAAAGGALAGAALGASPEAEAQAAWDSAAGGAGTSSLEKSAANAAGDSWAQALGEQEASASNVDLGGDGGFGDAGGDFGSAGGDFGGDAGGFGDAGGDFGGDAGGFGDAGSFGAADDGFGGGDLGAAGTDNGGFGAADDGFGADAGGDFGAASGDAGSFGANDDGFGSDAGGDFGADTSGGFGNDAGSDFGADTSGDFGNDAGGDFGADTSSDFGTDTSNAADAGGFGDAAADSGSGFGGADDGFGADAGGFGDAAASGDSAGFGGADDGFGADAGGFGDASGDLNAASGDAGGFGDLGGDAGGFGDAGGDFGGAAADGGFGDAGGFGDDAAAGGDFGGDAGGFGDLGGDAGGFGDDSGGFGDAGGDFGGDAGGFGDLGGDTGGDFGSGGFDDMDLAGDDAKQFAQSMQNAGSGNFPKTEALAPEVNETSAKTDDHTPAAPAADLSDVLAQEAPVEDKAQHESHEQPADHSAALPAAVGAGLAAAAAALAQDKAKKEEAAPQEHAERQAPDMSALDAEQPASGEELPLDPALEQALAGESIPTDAELKQEEPALSNVFDNLVDGKTPDEILAETPEGKNLDSVYDRFFTEDGEVAPEVVEAAEEVNSTLDHKAQPQLDDGLYLPPEGLAEATEHAAAPQSDEEKSLAAAFGAEPEMSEADKAMAAAFGAEPEPSDADKAMAAAFGAEPEMSDADKAMAAAFGAEPEPSDADKAMAAAFGAESEVSDADKAMAAAFGAEPEMSDADKAMAAAFGAEPEMSDADKAMAAAFGAEPEPSDSDKAMAAAFGAEPEMSDADKAMAAAFGAEPSDADKAMADAFGAEPSDADKAMADAFGAAPGELGAGITDLSGDLDAPEPETTPDLADTEFAGFNVDHGADDELPSLDAGLKNLGAAAQPEDEESSLSQALAQASAQRADKSADSPAEPDHAATTELESLQDTFNVPEDSAEEIAREAVPQTAAQEAKDLADVLGTSLDHADLKDEQPAPVHPDSDALMSADETFGEHGAELDEHTPDFVDLSHEDNIIPGDNSVQGQDFKAFDLGGNDEPAAETASDHGDIFGTDGDAAISDDELFGHSDSAKGDWEQGFNHYDEPVDDSDDHDFVNFANNLHRQEALAADEAADFQGIHEYDADHDLEMASAPDTLAVPEDQGQNSGSTADNFDADASNAMLDSIEQAAEQASDASAEEEASVPDFADIADTESSDLSADNLLGDLKSDELDQELADQDLDGVSSYDSTSPYDDTADEENNLIMPSAEELAQGEPESDLGALDSELEEAPAAEDLADVTPADNLTEAAPADAADLELPTHDILDAVSAHTNDLDADISADEDLKGLSSYDKDERYADTDLILPGEEETAEPADTPSLDDLDSADLESALDNLDIPEDGAEFEPDFAEDASADADLEPSAESSEAKESIQAPEGSEVPDAQAAGVEVEPASEFETERAHAIEEPFINVEDAEVASAPEAAAPIEPEQSDEVEDVTDSETELEPSMWSVPSDEDFDLPHVSGVSAADLEPAAVSDAEVVAQEPVPEADDADLSAAGFTTHDLDDLEAPASEPEAAETEAPAADALAADEPAFDADFAEPEAPAFGAEPEAFDAEAPAESPADLGADFASEIDKDLDSGGANWPEPDLEVGDSDDELFSSRIGSADALADMLDDVPADIPEEVVRQSGSHIAADTEPLNLEADHHLAPEAAPAEVAPELSEPEPTVAEAEPEPAGAEAEPAEPVAAEPSIEEALAQAPSADSSGAAAAAIVGDMVSGSGSDDDLLGADLGLDHDSAAAQSDELMGSMMADTEAEPGAEPDFGDFGADFGAESGDFGAEAGDLGAADFDLDALGSGADLEGLPSEPETAVVDGAEALDEGDLGAADFDFDALGDLDQSGDGDLGSFGDLDADGFDLDGDTSATEGDFSDLGAMSDDPSALDGLDGLDSLDAGALEGLDGLDLDEPKAKPKA